MKKTLIVLIFVLWLFPFVVSAESSYTVRSGDSMWKIAERFKIGVTEIIEANPQIENPDLIYPDQKLTIPTISELKSIEHKVIQLTNQERAKYGLPALKPDWELSRVARYKSEDIANKGYFSHTSPTYGSPFKMMRNFGIKYQSAAENLAQGQKTPKEVVKAWMGSSGHRKNILNKKFTHIGVGYAKKGNNWTQMFIEK
ncbi:SafA/ExsA family spore coat assembly protein [Aquibacillus sp. 3ASR75-11]|uniref:SafA/ExsA family spore coat assembly protein n=1 Tax=Terrihalobacillus insolitus TaxID=2950438 RepID=A0A9X3WTN7_9BACI|nr:SafA/ExsA family spore coat assembly protein [Terrihalobacillus insolitus]MDC3414445.1 SafA/ExsA family spore coat assembly protein [Terrihalobacillus insolitus]MDC3425325.1 SafA/ExsA family spore coat assembly protein [Terrihalobacillus insolitus]